MKTDKQLAKSLGLAYDKKVSVSRIRNWSKYSKSEYGVFTGCFHIKLADTVSAILSERAENKKTLALIFASAKNPGGGVRRGAKAQEEMFCAVTSVLPLLESEKGFYEDNKRTKLKTYLDDALLAKDVSIYFDRYGNRIKNEHCDALFYPSPNRDLCNENEAKFSLLKRMKNILDISREYDSLVLGEWGTGVFGNKKENVANLFLESIQKYGEDRNIIFTSYEEKNIDLYRKIFKNILKD